jgi:hypothetical protein
MECCSINDYIMISLFCKGDADARWVAGIFSCASVATNSISTLKHQHAAFLCRWFKLVYLMFRGYSISISFKEALLHITFELTGMRGCCRMSLLNPWCTPGMGVNLWGESPLYMNPIPSFDDGNESTSRRQGQCREALSEGSRSAKL